MKKANLIFATCFILLSIFFYNQTLRWDPSPAALPRFSLSLIIIFSIFMVIKDRFTKEKKSVSIQSLSKESLLRVIIFILMITGYILSINFLGLYVSSLLFIIVVLLYIGVKDKVVILGVPILFVVFLYFTFSVFLRLKVPMGIFFS